MKETQTIDNILTRGVVEVIQNDVLRAKLAPGKPLRIKFGIDPTSPNIHIGRACALWKLRDFQDLGHQIVFIVGDFTAVIGDTSDKDSERPMLSREKVEENLTTYFEQAGKILDMTKVEQHRNTEWLEKLTYREIGEHADAFSVADFIARDNIKRRLDAGKRVSLREVLYPLMQGYDSVAIDADVEIGGSDQRFNILAGRTLQNAFGKESQQIILLDLLEGLDGRKMSSSYGNTINVNDEPNDMFGKVMSLRDELMIKYFTYATRVPMSKIEEIKQTLEAGVNPRDVKLDLAQEIVSMYHGKDDAMRAREAFIATFQKKATPDDVEEVRREEHEFLVDVLLRTNIVASKTDFRRLVDEGAIKRLDPEVKIEDAKEKAQEGVYKIGKKRFIKII